MRFNNRTAAVALTAIAIGSNAISAKEPPDSASQDSASHYCTLFSKVRDNLSKSFGSRVDPLTRFAGMEVICDHKAMIFRQSINIGQRDITQDWVQRRSQHWSKTYCDRHPAFANAIRDGWTISTVMSLADGSALRIDAACHDAEA